MEIFYFFIFGNLWSTRALTELSTQYGLMVYRRPVDDRPDLTWPEKRPAGEGLAWECGPRNLECPGDLPGPQWSKSDRHGHLDSAPYQAPLTLIRSDNVKI